MTPTWKTTLALLQRFSAESAHQQAFASTLLERASTCRRLASLPAGHCVQHLAHVQPGCHAPLEHQPQQPLPLPRQPPSAWRSVRGYCEKLWGSKVERLRNPKTLAKKHKHMKPTYAVLIGRKVGVMDHEEMLQATKGLPDSYAHRCPSVIKASEYYTHYKDQAEILDDHNRVCLTDPNRLAALCTRPKAEPSVLPTNEPYVMLVAASSPFVNKKRLPEFGTVAILRPARPLPLPSWVVMATHVGSAKAHVSSLECMAAIVSGLKVVQRFGMADVLIKVNTQNTLKECRLKQANAASHRSVMMSNLTAAEEALPHGTIAYDLMDKDELKEAALCLKAPVEIVKAVSQWTQIFGDAAQNELLDLADDIEYGRLTTLVPPSEPHAQAINENRALVGNLMASLTYLPPGQGGPQVPGRPVERGTWLHAQLLDLLRDHLRTMAAQLVAKEKEKEKILAVEEMKEEEDEKAL